MTVNINDGIHIKMSMDFNINEKILKDIGFLVRMFARLEKVASLLGTSEEAVLGLVSEKGRLSTKDISKEMKIKPDVLSHILWRLQNFEKKGKKISLIKREINEDDMRGRYILATGTGKKILLENTKRRAKRLAIITSTLTEEETKTFSDLLEKMSKKWREKTMQWH